MASAAPKLASRALTQHEPAIRILLADDLMLVREGFAAICRSNPGLDVVGECSDGETALRLIQELQPDAALLDWGLPRLCTLEVIKQGRVLSPGIKFGVLAASGERQNVLESLRAGAGAFVLKSGPATQIADALEQMSNGGIYLSPMLQIKDLFSATGKPRPLDPMERLSPRELQVFTLLVQGLRIKEIAGRMRIQSKSVDTYRANLMKKLEIYDVAGLVKFSMRRSITGPP